MPRKPKESIDAATYHHDGPKRLNNPQSREYRPGTAGQRDQEGLQLGSVRSTATGVERKGGADVHAIFLGHDSDGKSLCICQALFPNKKDSWQKIEKSLKGCLDADGLDAFRTQVTLPFKSGANGRIQIKVYDARGNAVVKTVTV